MQLALTISNERLGNKLIREKSRLIGIYHDAQGITE